MQKLMLYFQPNFYYIDALYAESRIATRILMTRLVYDHMEPVNLWSDGSPIRKKSWRHADYCFYDGNWVNHELEIAIEVDREDCEWLYENTKMYANNHCLANKKRDANGQFKSGVCHQYNTFGRFCRLSLNQHKASVRLSYL